MRIIKPILSRIRGFWVNRQDQFLKDVKGVIHIGASVGQERELYEKHELDVLWIEPIPDVFEKLTDNIESFDRQEAINALVCEEDDKAYDFHVASNGGESSSIFEPKLHSETWPSVTFDSTLKLVGKTLPTLLKEEGVVEAKYDTLILDTQGSELSILKGCGDFLGNIRYVKSEVADYEAYEGCCQLHEMIEFFKSVGFTEVSRRKFGHRSKAGLYYDIVFKNSAC